MFKSQEYAFVSSAWVAQFDKTKGDKWDGKPASEQPNRRSQLMVIYGHAESGVRIWLKQYSLDHTKGGNPTPFDIEPEFSEKSHDAAEGVFHVALDLLKEMNDETEEE